jgi:hypothetical protein
MRFTEGARLMVEIKTTDSMHIIAITAKMLAEIWKEYMSIPLPSFREITKVQRSKKGFVCSCKL